MNFNPAERMSSNQLCYETTLDKQSKQEKKTKPSETSAENEPKNYSSSLLIM